MFSLFLLPGKAIANLWYLWPKKGEVLASARRKESSFVHFVYSLVFYGIVAFFALGAFDGSSTRDRQSDVGEAAAMGNSGYQNEDISDLPAEPSFETNSSSVDPENYKNGLAEPMPAASENSPPTPPGIQFESRPIVQEISPSEIEVEEGQ